MFLSTYLYIYVGGTSIDVRESGERRGRKIKDTIFFSLIFFLIVPTPSCESLELLLLVREG